MRNEDKRFRPNREIIVLPLLKPARKKLSSYQFILKFIHLHSEINKMYFIFVCI